MTQREDHGGDAGVRSRESRRSLRPHHFLPAASDHSAPCVLGEWDRNLLDKFYFISFVLLFLSSGLVPDRNN